MGAVPTGDLRRQAEGLELFSVEDLPRANCAQAPCWKNTGRIQPGVCTVGTAGAA